MRIAVSCAALALLAGCSVVPREAWTFDPTHPAPKPALEMAQAVALTERVAALQLQRNEVRSRIAAEPDVWSRLALYSRLHGIGMELSPLERQLSSVASAR
jgi:hypothetical protein